MAATPVQFKAPTGLTLTLKLYPYGSDTIANGAGDAAAEKTNNKGTYEAIVAEAITGWHDASIVDGSGNVSAAYSVYLEDDTEIKRCHDAADRIWPVEDGAVPPAAAGASGGLIRHTTDLTIASGKAAATVATGDGVDAYTLLNMLARSVATVLASPAPTNTRVYLNVGPEALWVNSIVLFAGTGQWSRVTVADVDNGYLEFEPIPGGFAPSSGETVRLIPHYDVSVANQTRLDRLDATISSRSTYAGGAVASVAGAVGSVAAGGITTASFAAGATVPEVTTVGSTGLTAIAAAVKAALLGFVRLITRKDAATATDNAADLTLLNANSGTGAGAYANTTDSLEAAADAGGGGLTAQQTRDAMKLAASAGAAAAGSIDDKLNGIEAPREVNVVIRNVRVEDNA